MNLRETAELFCHNFLTASSMYNRGQFDFFVARETAGGRLDPEMRLHLAVGRKPQPVEGYEWLDLRGVTSELRRQADEISPVIAGLREYADTELYAGAGRKKLWPEFTGFENLLKSTLRTRAIYYEVHDYYLESLEHEAGYYTRIAGSMRKDGVARCIGRQFESTFGFAGEEQLINVTSEEWVLLGLVGINALYRYHSQGEYRRGLECLDAIEAFTAGELKERREGRASLGLLALAQYLRARLHFGLGEHEHALKAATASSQSYARKGIRQERAMLQHGEVSPAEFEEKHMIALRRSALSTSLGLAHIQIVGGKIADALNLLTLSRAALSTGCGEIYARYVDVLWAEGHRALHSSTRSELLRAARVLRRSRHAFAELVTESHYSGRSSVELAVVYFYLLMAFDRAVENGECEDKAPPYLEAKREKLFGLAVKYYEEAIGFASKKRNGKLRNPRLAAEAYIIRSRLHMMSRPERDCEAAREAAREAVECAGDMPRYRCEALITLATPSILEAEQLQVERPRNFEAEVLRKRDKAVEILQEALRVNKGENKRLQSLCLLRLAQASTLSRATYPDIRFYLDVHRAIADQVEHAFVKELAEEVEAKAREVEKVFYADVRETWNVRELSKSLKGYLVNEFINELAEVIGGEPPSRENRVVKQYKASNINVDRPGERGGFPTIVSFLANNLQHNIQLPRVESWKFAELKEREFLYKCELVRNARARQGR